MSSSIGKADHLQRVANRKVAAPATWEWFRFEAIGDDAIMLTGCDAVSVFTKGPRKGKPTYREPQRRVVITDAEIAEEYANYEAETGKCGKCLGEGRIWWGWDHETGTKYRECPTCHGNGAAVELMPKRGAR